MGKYQHNKIIKIFAWFYISIIIYLIISFSCYYNNINNIQIFIFIGYIIILAFPFILIELFTNTKLSKWLKS